MTWCHRRVARHTVRRLPLSRAFALAGLIVIVGSVSVAMSGIVLALAEGQRAISFRHNEMRSIYLAQAGVMQALYDFRAGSGIVLGEKTVEPGPQEGLEDDDVFLLSGKAADFLLVNMIPALVDQGKLFGATRDRLRLWRLRNVLRSDSAPTGLPVQIDRLTISWDDPGPKEGVIRVEISGRKVWPPSGAVSKPQPSGTQLDILDIRVKPQTELARNTIWFSTKMVMQNKAFIQVAFQMSDHQQSDNPLDASIRIARYTPALKTRSANFTVKAVGEARRSRFPFVMWRHLQAEYRLSGVLITSPGSLVLYEELGVKTPSS